jgi:tetratricopeptide (TPR) repeat protein
MCPSFASLLLLALATAVPGPPSSSAAARSLSFRDFSDWNFANTAGQRALGRGNLDIAARRFHTAIAIARPVASSDPRLLARSYNDLALVLVLQGRAGEAEPLAQWALTVREQWFGKDSVQAAVTLHILAQITSSTLQYSRAEAYLVRAIAIWQDKVGADDPQVAIGLNDLATVYSLQRKYDWAESTFRRVLKISTRHLPADHPDRAISLIGLGSLYVAQGEFAKADSVDQELLAMFEMMFPQDYSYVAGILQTYLARLRRLGRTAQAATIEEAAQAVRTGENRNSVRLRDLRRSTGHGRPDPS